MKDRLVRLRKQAGFEKRLQLSAKISARPPTIALWEQGKRLPSAKDGIELANLYGVTLDYLYLGKEDSPIKSEIPEKILLELLFNLDYLYRENDMLFSRVCGDIAGFKMQTEIINAKQKDVKD